MSHPTGKSRPREWKRKITLPPFLYTIHLVVSSDVQKSLPFYRHLFEGKAIEAKKNSFAITVVDKGNSNVLMLMPQGKVGASTVCHECFHAIHHILQDSGVEFEEEVYAYSLGHLVDKVGKFVWYGPARRRKK